MHLYHDHLMRNKFVKTTVLDTIFFFSAYLYITFLSPYLKELGYTQFQISWFFTIFTVTSIFVTPFIGTISDSIGRFKVIMIGFFVEILALLLFVISQNTAVLIFARVLDAIAYSCVVMTAIARVNDTIETSKVRNRVNGLFHTITAIATIIAPIIGGVIADKMGYQAVFQAAIIFLLAILGITAIIDKFTYKKVETRKKKKYNKKDINLWYNLRTAFEIEHVKSISILGAVINFSVPVTTIVLPYLILTKLGMTNLYLSFVIATLGIGKLTQVSMGKLGDKIGAGKGIFIGAMIISITFLLLFISRDIVSLIILILINSVGIALWNVAATSYISEIGELHGAEGKVWGSYFAFTKVAQTFSYILAGLALTFLKEGILLVYSIVILAGIFFTRKHIASHIEHGKIIHK